MACNAENSTSRHHAVPHKHRNRHRPISDSIPNPKPRTHYGQENQDRNQRTISALMSRKEKEGGKSKFIGFGALGCVSSSPEVIRTAADWEARKKKKKKKVRPRSKGKTVVVSHVGISADVCCGPGIGFAADAALVDCVDSRRPVRQRTSHRQRSTSTRLPMPSEDADNGAEVTVMRQFHRLHRRTPGGLPEIPMLENIPSCRASFGVYDRFGGWRLDVDSMSYEELVALGDKIGYVDTGLKEEEIHRYMRKTKHSMLESLPLLLSDNKDQSCSICQEGFEPEEEMGKLECNHLYHLQCIKQWLLQKNACPVCKAEAAATKP